ncbi:hypothetical protein C8R45DRAFT_947862 [Mycena sanguinolenta]|nr:hypothetical protein C8R45DRAFT_947862 [Mycena sanguinolenta]
MTSHHGKPRTSREPGVGLAKEGMDKERCKQPQGDEMRARIAWSEVERSGKNAEACRHGVDRANRKRPVEDGERHRGQGETRWGTRDGASITGFAASQHCCTFWVVPLAKGPSLVEVMEEEKKDSGVIRRLCQSCAQRNDPNRFFGIDVECIWELENPASKVRDQVWRKLPADILISSINHTLQDNSSKQSEHPCHTVARWLHKPKL